MQISVPQRGVADRDSFPVEPADVGAWLEGLSLASESDAREVHRGLKHSNRLHNDPERRRAVLERFLPVLGELHERLVELTRAQPLPLVREFARATALVEALLREEAFAFKILLADSELPDPEDARRAMRALARQADVVVHGYRHLPGTLLEDAHALYGLAESRGMLDAVRPGGTTGLLDHYRYILLVAAADTHQLRARQLPLALELLREAAGDVALERVADDDDGLDAERLAVDIERGARPERVASLLVADSSSLRLLDVAPLLLRIDRQIARTRVVRSNTLGVNALERRTLGRLRTAFAGGHVRRTARLVANASQSALFGHREITARLLFVPAEGETAEEAPPPIDGERWTLVNRSSQGASLMHPACLPGTVQVGELVALDGPPDSGDRPPGGERIGEGRAPEGRSAGGNRPSTLLGVVRWVRSDGGSGVSLGLEYLARGVMPVSVVPSDADAPIPEQALIIACKVQRSIVQTILLPPYLYEVGEQLTASQGRRSRKLRLQTSLQTNGLFGHFLIG